MTTKNINIVEGSVSKTSKDGYEVWKPDGNVAVELTDNSVFSDILIDATNAGDNLFLSAPNNPSGWVIENVGWKGVQYVWDVSGWYGVFHMTVSGDGRVENVHIDNRTTGTLTEMGGGFVPRHHSGKIEVRNTYIAGNGNNAFYGSNAGKNGGGNGYVEFYNCFHRDNTVSQFRMANGLVKNCVGIVSDESGNRGVYPNTDSQRARGVWVRSNPDNRIEDSVMYIDPDDAGNNVSPYMFECFSASNNPTEVSCDNALGNDYSDGKGLYYVDEDGCSVTVHSPPETGTLTMDVLGDGGVPTTSKMAAKGNRKYVDPEELDYSDSGGSDDSSTLEDRVTALEEDVSALQSDMSDLKETNSSQTSQLDDHEMRISNLETTASDHDSRISRLKKKLNNVIETLRSLTKL